jgi:hypothetical protein
MRRRLVLLLALVVGTLVGAAFMRRAGNGRRDHVDLYYEDGSLARLADGEAAPLLDIARSALRSTSV